MSYTPTAAEVAQRRAAIAADQHNRQALEQAAFEEAVERQYSPEEVQKRAEAQAARNRAAWEEGQRILRERNAALAAQQEADREARIKEHLHRLWLDAGGRESEFSRQYPKLREQYLTEQTLRAATGRGDTTELTNPGLDYTPY